jgi:hypothetical protein
MKCREIYRTCVAHCRTGKKKCPVRKIWINFKLALPLTLNQLMLHICGVSKMFGEWYQKTNKTEDTNKLTLLAFKIIAVRRQSNNV